MAIAVDDDDAVDADVDGASNFIRIDWSKKCDALLQLNFSFYSVGMMLFLLPASKTHFGNYEKKKMKILKK